MRAVFSDYHIMSHVCRYIELLDMARLLHVYPWMAEPFIRNRRALVKPFDAINEADVLTGIDWVDHHFGYARAVRHLLGVDLATWSSPYYMIMDVITKDYRATFASMLQTITLEAQWLTEICRHGRAEMLMDALDYGYEIKCERHNASTSPLTSAVENGHTCIVDMLFNPELHWCIHIVRDCQYYICWEIIIERNDIAMAMCFWKHGWKTWVSHRMTHEMERVVVGLMSYHGPWIDELVHEHITQMKYD